MASKRKPIYSDDPTSLYSLREGSRVVVAWYTRHGRHTAVTKVAGRLHKSRLVESVGDPSALDEYLCVDGSSMHGSLGLVDIPATLGTDTAANGGAG